MRLRIRSCILFLFFLMVFFTAGAQQVNVRVRIINSKNEAVSFATVQLISVNDTNQVEQKLSDSTGILQFNAAEGAQYTLRFSAVNYLPAQKGIVVKGTSPLFTMVVEPSNKNLKTVVVTASRPLMRQEDDKTIIDPENLVASSTTAYEVIEKT